MGFLNTLGGSFQQKLRWFSYGQFSMRTSSTDFSLGITNGGTMIPCGFQSENWLKAGRVLTLIL
jgi:hypothetical protein